MLGLDSGVKLRWIADPRVLLLSVFLSCGFYGCILPVFTSLTYLMELFPFYSINFGKVQHISTIYKLINELVVLNPIDFKIPYKDLDK